MKYIYTIFSMLVFGLYAVAHAPAKAEVFVWQDPEFNINFVYPDLWREQFNAHPDVKLHVMAPQGRDYAACKITAKQDKRFMMYPVRYTQRVNSIVFSADNLRQHYIEKEHLSLIRREDSVALGKADAVYAEVRFVGKYGPRAIPMQSLAFATLYGDMYLVFECEAAAQNWPYWHPIFMNMAKSIDFPLWQDMNAHGFYPYDFMNEGDILLSTDNAKTGTLRY